MRRQPEDEERPETKAARNPHGHVGDRLLDDLEKEASERRGPELLADDEAREDVSP